MAPQEGLEPTTLRLTAECSAIELLRQKVDITPPYLESGGDLLFRAVSSQVPSALKGLTSVFGMGTGGTPSPLPPEIVCSCQFRTLTTAQVKDDCSFLTFPFLSDLRLSLAEIKPSTY